tara:strand:- start:101 stop:571 length:471 start_codon:yes stop_codon:yes gene_type:complete
MNETDIAKFAESLMEQEVSKGTPVQFAAPQSPDAPDVSEIRISEDFASQVINEGHWDKAQVHVKEKAVKSTKIQEEEEYKSNLVDEYKQKVSELNVLVEEMTSMGMLENFAGGFGGVSTVGRGGAGAGGAPMRKATAPGPLKRKKKKKKNARRSTY